MKFSLTSMIRRLRNPRRRRIPIRDIAPSGVMAADLLRTAYQPVVQVWERAVARILTTYERTLAAMTTDSPADVQADLDGIAAEIDRLVLELTPRLRDWVLRTERWHRGKWRGAVLAASGVDLQTMLGPEEVRETLETLLNRNVALMRDISDQARGRIAEAVFRGLTNRTPARDVAKELREDVGMARGRAIRVASDQLTKMTSALDSERMRQAGLDVWRWRHSGKLHPRQKHLARNGNLYSDNPERVGTVVDGETVLAEPPADDLPGIPPFCGCRRQALVVFD